MYILPNKSSISCVNRLFLWILLIVVTCTLLLSPVSLLAEYKPIQAPNIFITPVLFYALFTIWLLLLFILIFIKKDTEKVHLESLVIVTIFSLVFIGFWIVITPYGSYADSMHNMGHVRYLLDYGNIPIGHQNLAYFDFPGMHILVAIISQIINLSVFNSAAIFLIINCVLFANFIYLFFNRILKSNRLSLIGLFIVIILSVVIVDDITVFYPRAFGFTLLIMFLFMYSMFHNNNENNIPFRLSIIILFITITISYFAVSFFIILILFGIYIMQMIANRKKAQPLLTIIFLLCIIMLTWEVYWTWRTFNDLITFFTKFTNYLVDGEFLTSIFTLSQANLSSNIPIWANVTRIISFAFLFIGSLIGIINIFRIKNLTKMELMKTGGFIGTLILFLIGLLGTEQGLQFTRYLLYAPLFCTPIMLYAVFYRYVHKCRKLIISVLTLVIFCIATPSFLSAVNTVSTDAIYRYDILTGEFLEEYSLSSGKNIVLYSFSSLATSFTSYYIPECSKNNIPSSIYYSNDLEMFWFEAENVINKFHGTITGQTKQKLFIISLKNKHAFQHLLNILPEDSKWNYLELKLSNDNLIYNNSHVNIYCKKD